MNISRMRSRIRSRKAQGACWRISSGGLSPACTFDSFVCGAGNRVACVAAREVAARAGGGCHPLLICGGVGVGKTHLLHAVGNELRRTKPWMRIGCFSSEMFMNDMINALRHKKMTEFRNRVRTMDLLLIDDIHFMAGKEATQEEFLHTLDALRRGGKGVVATSRAIPGQMAAIDEALFSRLCGGVVAEIRPPDRETMLMILMRKCFENGVELPQDVAHHLSAAATGDVRRLEGALLTLKAFADVMDREITVELAKRVASWRIL